MGAAVAGALRSEREDVGDRPGATTLEKGEPVGVEPIADFLDAKDALTRREAARSLAIMKDLPIAQAQAGRVAGLMDDEDQVVRLVAAVGLASLADRDDSAIMQALEDHYLVDDRELRWNVTLTLAKLGRAKPLLYDLLERHYWEQADFVRYQTQDGAEVNRPLSKNEVRSYLVAAIEAAAGVDDQQVRGVRLVIRHDRTDRRTRDVHGYTRKGQQSLGATHIYLSHVGPDPQRSPLDARGVPVGQCLDNLGADVVSGPGIGRLRVVEAHDDLHRRLLVAFATVAAVAVVAAAPEALTIHDKAGEEW